MKHSYPEAIKGAIRKAVKKDRARKYNYTVLKDFTVASLLLETEACPQAYPDIINGVGAEWFTKKFNKGKKVHSLQISLFNHLIAGENAIDWAIRHGYVSELAPEVFYKVGNTFKHKNGNIYKVLRYFNSNKVVIYNTAENHVVNMTGVIVKNPQAITEHELCMLFCLCSGHSFFNQYTQV